jgi:hypothetical protein
MKYSFLRIIAIKIFGVGIMLLFIVSLLNSVSCNEQSDTSEKIYCTSPTHIEAETELAFTANDFEAAHQFGKPESIQSIVAHPLQAEKLIRSAIFDHDCISELTRTLTWYVRSTYFASLSPLWCPSITIAHRRLII